MAFPSSFRILLPTFQNNRILQSISLLTLIWFSLSFSTAHANALTANFDDLSPGTYSNSITDGGITFSNLYIDSTGDTGFVDIATTTDTNFGFSGTNFLTSGGDLYAMGDIYSMTISFSGIATNASLTVGALGDPNESNTLTLEAFNGANIVATDTYSGFAGYDEVSGLLSASWSSGFTSLLLVVNQMDTNNPSSDVYGDDFLTFGISNVVVNTVPEPTTVGLLFVSLPAVLLLCNRTNSKRLKKYLT